MDRRRRAARTVALMSLFTTTDTQTDVPIASCDGDGSDLISLIVGIEPVQAGSGDPSPDNVRPISGWIECKVTRTGRNLLDMDDMVGNAGGQHIGTLNADGSLTVTVSGAVSVQQLLTGKLKAGKYTVTNLTENLAVYIQIGSGIDYAHRVAAGGGTRTFDYDGTSYLRVLFEVQSANSTEIYKAQLELGSTATSYEPYQGETYTITFPSSAGTVYGGTLDVTTGKLTVDRAMVDLGTLNWTLDTRYANRQFYIAMSGVSGDSDTLCSSYKPVAITWSSNENGTIGFVQNGAYLLCVDNDYSTVAAFKAAVSGVQLCYELATPIVYDLTPTQVTTLIGTNNIWADTGDIKYIEYNI